MKNVEVRSYMEKTFDAEDAILRSVRFASKEQGLPPIHVSSQIGKFLHLLVKIHCSKRILEIGTLGGYSTIWLARALPPEGQLLSLELNPFYAEIAKKNIEKAGLNESVEIRQGLASYLLEELIQTRQRFDFIFIDADKSNSALYLNQTIQLLNPKGLILIDNLIPKGEKVGIPCNGEAISVYSFNQYLANHPHLESVLVTTVVGPDGRLDGLGVARLKE